MRRRDFLILTAGVVGGRPALSQQKPMSVIGYLSSVSPGPIAPYVAAFRQGLSERGCVEGSERVDRVPLGGGLL